MKKISQLPLATLPLTGSELLPIVQDGRNKQAAVGVAQVLEAFGELPTDAPIGKLIYVADAAGGTVPAFWDGTQWRQFGGTKNKVKPMGEGIWLVGIATSSGLAHASRFDQEGIYFVSRDGINWDTQVV